MGNTNQGLLPRVHLDPVLTSRGQWDSEGLRLALHQHSIRDTGRSGEHKGNGPQLGLLITACLGTPTVSQEPRLLQLKCNAVIVPSLTQNLQVGVTHLLSPGSHHAGHIHSRHLLPGAPQIKGDGVAVLMSLHVQLQALLELVGTQHARHHAHDSGPLAVADGVEHLLHLLGACHGNLDGVR